jgi:chemotaxis protein CheD
MSDLLQQPEIHVSIGEVKISRGGKGVLKSSLGSCVGIALLWKKKKIYGLAHCLLAEAPGATREINARFVSQAVPSLLALMKIKTPEDFSEVEAVLAGGGNMTAPVNKDPKDLVGHINTQTAESYLKKYGIKIIHQDVGGLTGKKIRLFCETGEFVIQKIPRIDKATA